MAFSVMCRWRETCERGEGEGEGEGRGRGGGRGTGMGREMERERYHKHYLYSTDYCTYRGMLQRRCVPTLNMEQLDCDLS